MLRVFLGWEEVGRWGSGLGGGGGLVQWKHNNQASLPNAYCAELA